MADTIRHDDLNTRLVAIWPDISNAGKMWFVIFHVVWFALWLWLNGESKNKFAFDPFPFPFQLLSTIVSLESIFLSLFILMSQNRSNIQADQRNHLEHILKG